MEREAECVERMEEYVEREAAVEVVAEGGTTPEKAPNEPNLVSTESTETQEVESETRGLAKHERSQSEAGQRAARDAGTRGSETGAAGETSKPERARDSRPVTPAVGSDGLSGEQIQTGQDPLKNLNESSGLVTYSV